MSLRTKLVAALTMLAALASVLIGAVSYEATSDQLRVEVDRSLDDTAEGLVDIGRAPGGQRQNVPRSRFLDLDHDLGSEGRGYDLVSVQVLAADGTARAATGTVSLPVSVDDVEIAVTGSHDGESQLRRDVTIGDTSYRMLTAARRSGGGAVQVARSLAENERLLDTLRNRILVAVLLSVGLAAVVGWLIARQITLRLVRLTAAAEEVAGTGRLDVDVPPAGRDEAGRLAQSFRAMLGALAGSKADQQRLIQDAGHELRTPLTSLRTNVSVLRRHPDMSPEEMGRLLEDLDGETRELTDLVNELVELATDRRDDEPVTDVELGPLIERVAERSARRTGRQVLCVADASVVPGRTQALERAVGNLVDNAIKFDDGGTAPIEVSVRNGRIEVSDRGPGIDPADLEHLFDRFYRATAARSRPGSGLGLSIVKDVAQRHGGTVSAANRPGGGATIGFTLPLQPHSVNWDR